MITYAPRCFNCAPVKNVGDITLSFKDKARSKTAIAFRLDVLGFGWEGGGWILGFKGGRVDFGIRGVGFLGRRASGFLGFGFLGRHAMGPPVDTLYRSHEKWPRSLSTWALYASQ